MFVRRLNRQRAGRASGPIRSAIRANIPALTSARMAVASSSSVENAGSSSATLIRSGGWFFTSAADRISAAASARARRWS